MVPVPEDLAPKVKLLLIQLGFRTDAGQWDDDLMERHLRSLNPEARTLLSTVARRVRAGSTIEDVELAELMAVSVREVFGIVREVNAVTVAASPGDLLLFARRGQRRPFGPRRPNRVVHARTAGGDGVRPRGRAATHRSERLCWLSGPR